jgi:GDP-4-dehydro-6-deoxy-D-mannose reductase
MSTGMGSRLLLIGGTGFVGSHIAAAAESGGFDVVRCSPSGKAADLALDLLDRDSIGRALAAARPEWVCNMGGSASVSRSWREPTAAFELNVVGVVNLLVAAANTGADPFLLCVSSGEVYGQVDEAVLPLVETDDRLPVSPYGSSKASMEVVCEQFARSDRLRIAVLRPFNQIGPGQAEAFVASGIARQIAAAEAAGHADIELVVGNVGVRRDFMDVRDAARAYLDVVRGEIAGTYNLCSGRAVSIRELIDEMVAHTELHVSVRSDPRLVREGEAPVSFGSAALLRGATGWEASIPLGQTLRDLLDWWRTEIRTAVRNPTVRQ